MPTPAHAGARAESQSAGAREETVTPSKDFWPQTRPPRTLSYDVSLLCKLLASMLGTLVLVIDTTIIIIVYIIVIIIITIMIVSYYCYYYYYYYYYEYYYC